MVVPFLPALRRLRGWFIGAQAGKADARAVVQQLEPRALFSVGFSGAVVNEQLLGTDMACTGVVLTFDQPLDAASATNPKGYAILKRVDVKNDASSGVFGIGSSSSSVSVETRHTRIASVTYDAATDSVTLTPVTPFRADKFFRILQVAASGPNAILTAAGQPIDGGQEPVIKFASKVGKTLTYTDVDGDHVKLHLSGPGTIRALYRRTGSVEPIVYLIGTNPSTSVLTGTVKRGRHGNGTAILQEVSGTSTVQDDLTDNPDFDVLLTEP